MNEQQLLALLTIKAFGGRHTIKTFKKQFSNSKFGTTDFDFLMINGYIQEDYNNKKYCCVTITGRAVIEGIVGMLELLPRKYKPQPEF